MDKHTLVLVGDPCLQYRTTLSAATLSTVCPHRKSGFTLLELLVVISIIALLTSMLFPIVSIANRRAKIANTQSILIKVERSVQLFRSDYGVFPHQAAYPAAGPTTPFPASSFVNHLGYQVGTDIAANDATNVHADQQAARTRYAYNLRWQINQNGVSNSSSLSEYEPPIMADMPDSDSSRGPLAVAAFNVLGDANNTAWARLNPVHSTSVGSVNPNQTWWSSSNIIAMVVNRMLCQRASLAMVGGYTTIDGTLITLPSVLDAFSPRLAPWINYDMRSTPVVASPASANRPGWATNYLGDDLEAKFRSGDAILDAWHNPVIYIHQNSPGMAKSQLTIYEGTVVANSFDGRFYGLSPQVLLPPDLPLSGDMQLGIRGRIRLSTTDAGWGIPTPTNATYFPSTANLLDSDVRYYAAPGFDVEPELWSAGPDGMFCWRRSDPSNSDDVSAKSYDKGLQ